MRLVTANVGRSLIFLLSIDGSAEHLDTTGTVTRMACLQRLAGTDPVSVASWSAEPPLKNTAVGRYMMMMTTMMMCV